MGGILEHTDTLETRLNHHLSRKQAILTGASGFLARCQWMEEDEFKGTVCPWELNRGLDFQEDFHDTLEALWVWNRYRKASQNSNFDRNMELALKYIRKNAERIVFSKEAYPVTRCYDAAFLLLLDMELEGLEKEMTKAGELLKEAIRRLERFDQREYRNPLWHCSILYEYGKKIGDEDAVACAQRPLDAITEHGVLLPDYSEPRHEGPGRHDFFSSWGMTVYYLCTVEPDLVREIQRPEVHDWYQERERDEFAFNLSRCWGLGKLYRQTGKTWALEAFFDIWDQIPCEPEKGLPRQRDFPVPESWATFFQVFAYLSVDDD